MKNGSSHSLAAAVRPTAGNKARPAVRWIAVAIASGCAAMFLIGGHIAKLPMAGSALVGVAVAVAILVLRLAHTASRNGDRDQTGADPQLPGLNRLCDRWRRIDPLFEVQFGEYAAAAHDELTKQAELDDGEAIDDTEDIQAADTPLPIIVSKAGAAARPGKLTDELAPLSTAFDVPPTEPEPPAVKRAADPTGQRPIPVTAAVLPPALGRSVEADVPTSAEASVAA